MLDKINNYHQEKSKFPIKNIILAGLILLGILLFITPVTIAADNPSDNGKVYMIVVDKMSIYDITADHTPTMYRLTRGSSRVNK